MEHSAATTTDVVLSVAADNFQAFRSNLYDECIIRGGDAGKQILQDQPIDLYPFKCRPTKNDLDVDSNGKPIKNQYTYDHVSPLKAEKAEKGAVVISPSDLPLTIDGKNDLRKDSALYEQSLAARVKSDNIIHQFLYAHISPASLSSVKVHADYQDYLRQSEGFKSYDLFLMIRDIHEVGNATTKLHRLKSFVALEQQSLTHEEYLSCFNALKTSVAADFGSQDPAHKDYFHMDTLFCVLYLAGLDKPQFQPVLDQLLFANPSGRFENLLELQAQVQIWKTSRQISIPDPFRNSAESFNTSGFPPHQSPSGQPFHQLPPHHTPVSVPFYVPTVNTPSTKKKQINHKDYQTAISSFFTQLALDPDQHGSVGVQAALNVLADMCD